MKEDNLGPKNIKGDNSRDTIICAGRRSLAIWLTVLVKQSFVIKMITKEIRFFHHMIIYDEKKSREIIQGS